MAGIVETIQAIPTQYKGITYRSRSEARFAAFLDRAGRRFFYEPSILAIERLKYTVDFCSLSRGPWEELTICGVEYKPSEPNEDYKNDLLSKFSELTTKCIIFGFESAVMLLVCGNVYDEASRRVSFFYRTKCHESAASEGWLHHQDGWGMFCKDGQMDDALEYAKTYRYDLEE